MILNSDESREMVMQESFESHRPLMFAIAYRMLGSVMEAEDIIQEAFLRYQATPPESIRSPKAFLSTVVTRLCLDQLKSARLQRETYIGPWLPEPLLTGGEGATFPLPAQKVSEYESISMAFMVLLESLTPLERAVFLLREVFAYGYDEIAAIVDRSEAACRQTFHRAKQHVAENKPRFESSPELHGRMIANFMQAVEVGELDGLMELLTEDVTVWGDGGGKATAARRPVSGRETVAQFLLGIARMATSEMLTSVEDVNGLPALVTRVDGRVIVVMTLELEGERIKAIRSVLNPDKLAHLNAGSG